MAIFKPYNGLTAMIRQTFEKDGNRIRREELPGKMQELLQNTLKYLPTTPGHLNQETLTTLFELHHYLLSHKVYYIETNMATTLMKTDMKVQFSDLKLPYRVFEVSFKDDFTTPEGKIESFLVVMPQQAEIDSFNTFLEKTSSRIASDMSKLIYIRYSTGNGGICHTNIPIEFMNNKTIDEVVESLGERRNTFTFTIEFDERDKAIQKRMLRILMGLLCYINTESPDIMSWKNGNRPAFGCLKPDGWKVGSSLPEAWFMRRGHFMVLRDERYARSEDGKPRIVWRRPHEVLHNSKPLVPDARVENVRYIRDKEETKSMDFPYPPEPDL